MFANILVAAQEEKKNVAWHPPETNFESRTEYNLKLQTLRVC